MTAHVRPLRALAVLLALAPGAARLEAQPRIYLVDPPGSRLHIHLDRSGLMKFMGHAHEIEAPVAEGRVEVVDDDPSRSTVALRFESARLAVVPGSEPAGDIPNVEERMRGPEVLDAARHAQIDFVSKSVRSVATEGDRLRLVVAGTLTLRGRSVPVEVPLEVTRLAAESLEARGTANLSLRGLGIEPPSVAGVVKVADRFQVTFDIRASASAAPGSRDRKAGASLQGSD